MISNLNNSEEQVSQLELTGSKSKISKKNKLTLNDKNTILKSFQSDLQDLQVEMIKRISLLIFLIRNLLN